MLLSAGAARRTVLLNSNEAVRTAERGRARSWWFTVEIVGPSSRGKCDGHTHESFALAFLDRPSLREPPAVFPRVLGRPV